MRLGTTDSDYLRSLAAASRNSSIGCPQLAAGPQRNDTVGVDQTNSTVQVHANAWALCLSFPKIAYNGTGSAGPPEEGRILVQRQVGADLIVISRKNLPHVRVTKDQRSPVKESGPERGTG
jgi:hypothetical protein